MLLGGMLIMLLGVMAGSACFGTIPAKSSN
jgi:hypothetical protein